MSFNRCFTEKTPHYGVVLDTKHSKMVQTEEIISGNLCTKYEFGVADMDNDMRNDVNIYDFSLSNIRRLGKLGDLKECVLQRNDVDVVIGSLTKMQNTNESAQVPAQDSQA